ncbi:twitching motility protein PilJ [Nitrosospira sp. Nsp18]|nr:twitching motility protein PilJ [Nitrosospira sp. Nsp18]
MIFPYKSRARSVAGASQIPCGTADAMQIQNAYTRLSDNLDQSLTGICLFDAQTLHFHYLNKGARRNLGYDMDRLPMMTLFDIQPELDEASFRTMISPLVNGEKEALVFETMHLRADGTLYPAEVHLQWVTQSDCREFLAIMLDITSRRRAQLALQENEARFRIIANTIPTLSWILETEGSRSWHNQRWYDYTGTTPEEMKGWGWRRVHDPALLPVVIEKWNEAVSAGQAFAMEVSLLGADGQYRIFLTRAEPLKDAKGQ